MKKTLVISLLLTSFFLIILNLLAYAAPHEPAIVPKDATRVGPAPPSNLGLKPATVIKPTSITLQWTDNSSNETGFILETKKHGSSDWIKSIPIPANQTTYEFTSLRIGTTYDFRIKSVNLLENSSYSNVATITTASSLTIHTPNGGETLTGGNIHRIEWDISGDYTDSSGEVVDVSIKMFDDGDWVEIARAPANENYYDWLVPNIDLNPLMSIMFTHTIDTRSDIVNDYSDDTFTIISDGTSIPVPPSHLKVDASSSGVTLSWDHSNKRVGFLIERKVDDGDFEQIGVLSDHTLSYTDNDIVDGTIYTYRVSAVTGTNNSAYSDEVEILVPLNAPSDLTATMTSLDTVELTWTDNSENEDGFDIVRSFIIDGSHSLPQRETVEDNITSYIISGLSCDATYTFKVRAVNSSGISDFTTVDIDTPPAILDPSSFMPATPSNLNATVVSDSEISLSWVYDSPNDAGFRIERKTDGGVYTVIEEVGPGVTEFSDSELSQDTSYFYRVRAYNIVGNSEYSNEVNAVTQSPLEVDTAVPEEHAPGTDTSIPEDPTLEVDTDETVIKLYINKTKYYINNVEHEMDTNPIIRENRTFLPIRFVVEPIGASIGWNGDERKVIISLEGKHIDLWIDKNTAQVDEDHKLIDSSNPNVKPFIIPPGRTMLPIRFITEQLGCKVNWNSERQEVTIIYPAP